MICDGNMSVIAGTSPLKRLHQCANNEYTRFPATFKRPKLDAARNFPENCGQVVRPTERSRMQCYADEGMNLKLQSTSKHRKVDATRYFPRNCGSCVPQMNVTHGDTRSHVEMKCCSGVAGNVIAAKPLRVFVPTNWTGNRENLPKLHSEAIDCDPEENNIQIDLPVTLRTAIRVDSVAIGACTKEVGVSSHSRISCQQLSYSNGNQPLQSKEKGLMSDESPQQDDLLVNKRFKGLQKSSSDGSNRHDGYINVEAIGNGPQLPAIVSLENLTGGQNAPCNYTSKRVHWAKEVDNESKNGEDEEEICILSCSEWNSLKLNLKSRSASKKVDGGEILQEKIVGRLEPLGKCMKTDIKEPVPETICSEQQDGRDPSFKDRDESVTSEKQIVSGASREEVTETLKLFDDLYMKLLQEDKAKQCEGQSKRRQIHHEAATMLDKQNKWVNSGWTFGHVPGVEIGDQFQFRVELAMIGLHREFFRGIAYVDINSKYVNINIKDVNINGISIDVSRKLDVATSIVDSGRYDNEAISSETFIYVGQGGNPKFCPMRVEDQKLEGGNLALKNSMDLGSPVRVIGRQRTKDDKNDIRYIYDGLYTVTKYWQESGPTGKLVFKFELKRNLGQAKLTRELVSRPTKSAKVDHFPERVTKATAKQVVWQESIVDNDVVRRETIVDDDVVRREIIVDNDVSQGKEKIPIPAFNAIDDEKPPPFTYISSMKYPDWYYISTSLGCGCTNGCFDSEPCSCASRNGGEIPFNTRGAIIEAKPLVYECGPSCKCPLSCNNRVSQHGPRYHLEVFKTESRGWGLRSRDHISSGSFICEYVGELLDENEAEKRINHDEYLFDVGNYDEEIPKRNAVGINNLIMESNSSQRKDEDGFTLDAARYGNVGRFINHSCSPNLYAQNVLYDHGDRRVPHIMFFATKSIAPLQEITYHYNYQIGHVSDANGNLKKKNCSCGSRKCTGRMY